MAPEISRNQGHNYLADFYNLGTLAFELVCGLTPLEYFRKISNEMKGNFSFPILPEAFSAELKDFCVRLLTPEASKRLGCKEGISEILEHPWLKGVDFKQLEQRKGPEYLKVGVSGFGWAIVEEEKVTKNPFLAQMNYYNKKNCNENYFEIPNFYFDYQKGEENVLVEELLQPKSAWEKSDDFSSDQCSYSECMEEKLKANPSVFQTAKFLKYLRVSNK